MKTSKILVFLAFLLAPFLTLSAQEKPSAKKIDEFKKTGCCDSAARLDLLRTRLNADPNLKGYILLHGLKDHLMKNLLWERQLEGNLSFLGIDQKRVSFLRSELGDYIGAEVWVTHNNEQLPFSLKSKWDFFLPHLKKSKLFYNSGDESAVCTFLGQERHLAEVLSANKNILGNIVIFGNSRRKYQSEVVKLKKEFVEKLKVTVTQLRFIYVHDSSLIYGYSEYWLVPKKK